jgi:diguanylate cyclase (GGDEF)-like protein
LAKFRNNSFKKSSARISQLPSPIKQDDLVYLTTRAVSILAGLVWLALNPVSKEVALPLYFLFVFITFYSIVLYSFYLLYRKQKLKQIYLFLLPLDVIVLSFVTLLTGGPESPFIFGFFLLVVLPSFYYGLTAGLIMAFIMCLIDFSISLYSYPTFLDLIENSFFRLGFYWVLAISGGLLANRYLENEKVLQGVSQSLKNKVSILSLLFDISHSLIFELDLDHRKRAFSEVLKKAFHLQSFALVFLNNRDRKVSFKLSHNPEKINLSLFLKAIKDKQTFQEFQKKSSQPKFFFEDNLAFYPILAKETASGFLICLKEDLNKLSEEEIDSLSLFASLAGVGFDNALLHQQMKELSITDDLTGLYNHRLLKEQLEKEVNRAQRTGKPLSVVLLDLDNFKDYNEAFGHIEGDEILRKIGSLIRKNTRSTDFPVRYGGDEFAIICPDTSLKEAVSVAAKLQKAVSSYQFRSKTQNKIFKITMSAGVSTFPDHVKDLKNLLLVADEALFKAKSKGGNKMEIATPR